MENSKRLLALDVFRGLTVALMIVVNNPGSWSFAYAPLKHSAWHGCTPTDLVFPFFLFIIGSAMWYSYKKYNYTITRNLVLKIFRRAFLIYIIGLIIAAYSSHKIDLAHIRIMGVLPRIAMAYLFASFIVLGFRVKWVKIVTVIILLMYWMILAIFSSGSPFTLEDNFARTFDIAVLGLNHIPVFHGVKFDQTGLLSTLPSICNILLGYLAGRLIDTSENKLDVVKKLIIYGIAGIIIAFGWDFMFPINKPLWTSSFVLYTSGFASVFLGFLYWLIDIKSIKGWTMPFQVFGLNPITIYVLSLVLAITLGFNFMTSESGEPISVVAWIYTNIFMPAGPYLGSLLYALVFTFFCWLAGYILFRKKIFIRL